MFDTKKYILNSKLNTYKRRIEESQKIISETLDKVEKPYIAFSGGKDSTVLTHFITQKMGYKDILLFSQKDDCDFPEEKEYTENLIKIWNLNCEIVEPEESVWDYIISHKMSIDKDIHTHTHELTKKFFIECINKFIKKHNPDCVFMGLRNQESRARRMNYYIKGVTYSTKYDNLIHCNPLSLWKVEDIFSYLITNDIPIMPIYKKANSIKEAEEIRIAWWLPSGIHISFGYVLFLRTEYPELYEKIRQYFPEIAGAV